MPSYQTRVLTARDRRLVDALRKDPRYRKVADVIDPPQAGRQAGGGKPAPKAAQAHAEPAATDTPDKPAPAATGHDKPAQGHAVPAATSHDADMPLDHVEKPKPSGHKHSDR